MDSMNPKIGKYEINAEHDFFPTECPHCKSELAIPFPMLSEKDISDVLQTTIEHEIYDIDCPDCHLGFTVLFHMKQLDDGKIDINVELLPHIYPEKGQSYFERVSCQDEP